MNVHKILVALVSVFALSVPVTYAQEGPREAHNIQKKSESSQKIKDPICGMSVNPSKAAGPVDHKGIKYYFCSPGCMKKFQADPGKYANE